MSKMAAALRARMVTIIVWAVIILGLWGLVSYNRASQARQEATLSSDNQATRDDTVLSLVNSGRLIDVLTNTQNPNEDAKSDQNLKSVTIRENAADSVNRLIAEKKINDVDRAMNTLFLLRKDADSGVKDKATAGLATLGAQNDANLNKIVTRLSDGDPDIRSAAVDVLAKIGGDKSAAAADKVFTQAASQDAAKSALIKIGEPSVPYLVKRLEDPAHAKEITFRQQVTDMLNQIASPTAVPELTKLANQTEQPSVRRVALIALANIVLGTSKAVKTATDSIAKAKDAESKAKDDKARLAAQTDQKTAQDALTKAQAGLAQVQTAEPALIATLRNVNDDSEARSQAALALGQTAGPAAVQTLVAALGDYDARVRQAVLAGVQAVGAPAVAPLSAALSQGAEETRASASEALGGIGTPAALSALNAAFSNPATPAAVRQSAVVGMGRSSNLSAIGPLVRALGDSDGTVASAASDGLLSLVTSNPTAAKQAIPQLIASFGQPAPVPFNASTTLAQMGNLAVPALKAAAAGLNPQQQTWAAVTLGQTDSKDPSIVQALAPLKDSANPQVSYAASQALERLTRS